MTKIQISAYTNYKKFLLNTIYGEGNRGSLTRLAQAINCQRSYLSRVINKNYQLTPDQAFKTAEFLKLTKIETDYFMFLVEHDRCGNHAYRDHLSNKLTGLRRELESLSDRVGRGPISNFQFQNLTKYFTHWVWSAVHFICSSQKYQTTLKISNRLKLPEELIKEVVLDLKKFGFVDYDGRTVRYKGGDYHLAKDLSFTHLHHSNWRNKALVDHLNTKSDGVHYTCVQTIEKTDYLKLKAMLIRFIEDSKKLMDPSAPEELVAVCLDVFQI